MATIEIQPGQRDEFLKHFHENIPHVLQEQGCLEYVPTIDVETTLPAQAEARQNVVVVVEKWESIEALEAHLIAPHMVEYRKKVKDLVVGSALQIVEPGC